MLGSLFGAWYTGFLGIGAILAVAFLLSHHKGRIDWALVLRGLALQVMLGILLLQVPFCQQVVEGAGQAINSLLAFADQGAGFVFGGLVTKPQALEQLFGPGGAFIFALKLVSSIIFVSTLVSLAYHVGLLQGVVRILGWVVAKLLGASGAEALANTASVFVGQVEAQLLVKPYLSKATQSELLTMMSGSMACIAGGVLAIYIGMGIPAAYLLTASVMAIPGAMVIAKLILPETQTPLTRGAVQLHVEQRSVNLIDAASRGAMEGWQIGISVIVMLIAFVSLVGLADAGLGVLGQGLISLGAPAMVGNLSLASLSLASVLGGVFAWVAMLLGVAPAEAPVVGGLMGSKLILNEFVAYTQLLPLMQGASLSPKAIAVATFALCGFANLASVAIQVGGIGAMAPERKADLAKLGGWALLCGTLASYLSAAWAGILTTAQPWMMNHAPWLPAASLILLTLSIIVVSLIKAVADKLASPELNTAPATPELQSGGDASYDGQYLPTKGDGAGNESMRQLPPALTPQLTPSVMLPPRTQAKAPVLGWQPPASL
jgi:CNT family concentrative nucleoside transporter